MKLIVGLGNPGYIYRNSRHNIGFTVVKSLSKAYRVALKKEFAIPALSCKVKIDGQSLIIAMPLTFMNLSGSAVKLLVKKYKVGLSDLLIICDDLDLEFGRLRLRTAGSSAGHRGIQSIIDSLKNQEFNRLRIGIGRPKEILEASEYVLSPFKRAEKFQVQEIIETALLCCQCWVENGANKAMNIFNKRSL